MESQQKKTIFISMMRVWAILILLLLNENAMQVCFAEGITRENEITETSETDPQDDISEQSIAEKLAEMLIQAAVQAEPDVTTVLRSLESENARLVGLEHRFKSKESLARKIISDAEDMEITLEDAAKTIGDVLRYTLCIDDSQYVSTVDKALRTLEENHISVIKFRNRWGSEGYKGINVNLETQNGLILELQLHTPASYEAKELEHPNYEIARSKTATEEERIAAERFAKEIYAKVPVPEGAPEYVWEVQPVH